MDDAGEPLWMATGRIVGAATLGLVQIGADLVGVPGLSTAVKLMKKVADLALTVPRNRNQARLLSIQCGNFLAAIKRVTQGVETAPESFIGQLLSEFVLLLEEIQSSMIKWNGLGFLKALAYRNENAMVIAIYVQKLSSMKDSFEISALAKIGYEAEVQTLARRRGGSSTDEPMLQSAPEDRVANQVPCSDPDEVRYEESELQDRHDADRAFASSEIESHLHELEGMKGGDADGMKQAIGQAMGQAIEDLDSGDLKLKPDERTKLKQNLFLISEAIGQLPQNLRYPPDYIEFNSDQPIAGSSIYDIYKGTFFSKAVAIKKARSWACVEGSVEHILKEAKNWRSACEEDPNEDYILQLIAVSFPGESCIMISRWQEERDLLTYLRKMGENVNRRRIVRRIAEGLQILHQHKPTTIAHGHLKASNIMINDKGEPLLGDFGLSKSLQNITGQPMTEVQGVNSYRWFAPELLSDQPLISPMSDIYSFAMTVLELMTGEHPFKEIKRAAIVPGAVTSGQRPTRPSDTSLAVGGSDSGLWTLMTRCWVQAPLDRPNIKNVIDELEEMGVR